MNNTEIAADLRALADKIEGSPPATPDRPDNVPPPHLIFADIPAQYRHAEPGPYPGRYDDPVPDGTVGAVKMLVTGHNVSMAQPQYDAAGKLTKDGETIVPYLRRVRFQITANPDGTPNAEGAQAVINILGYAMGNSSTFKGFDAANPDTWPFAVDQVMNKEFVYGTKIPGYDPVDPADAAASIKKWTDGMQRARDEAVAAGNVPPVVPPTGPSVTDVSGNAPV